MTIQARCPSQAKLETVEQKGAVGQPGKGVVEGVAGESLGDRFRFQARVPFPDGSRPQPRAAIALVLSAGHEARRL
ncbi:MAG: hypothetical protein M3O55_00955 [Actinomycetota bacterium]|nr:hypothetical protein [Actinomycetota bacterium]